ncbi:MAG TPA: rhodanese-like domain-containing protein [Anaerolineales bacterium]|nr:rhodanese-like domain-containing protein [Anaerolineales bacterium]HNA89215.1 rhodanese-like domain-containing protein [Anaerolineales bacterium]HNB35740.1 rhodanese-like domain-containing protein [Anaerolineales bacterium]HNC08773.1 rhodanese-like domain-containing protein [Anaerolineales bacterium]
MIPEITVNELAEKLKSKEKFVLLDVRELPEFSYARIEDSRLEVLPLSRLADEGTDALPDSVTAQEMPVYVLCHHGNRSMQVTTWLMRFDYKNVFNVHGGIDAYALQVDSSVGKY